MISPSSIPTWFISFGIKNWAEDAYDRVFDCDHRDLVKEAFNAMMQSSTPLMEEPEEIDLSEVNF